MKRKHQLKKYILPVVLVVLGVMVLTLTLTNETTTRVEKDQVVTILMPYSSKWPLVSTDESAIGFENLMGLVESFNMLNEAPYRVVLKYIDTTDEQQYISERNALLMGEHPPELFFICDTEFRDVSIRSGLSALLKSGVALDVSDLLQHYKDLEPALQMGTYLPVGLHSNQGIYDRDTLKDLGIDDSVLYFDKDMLYDMAKRFVDQKRPELNYYEYMQIMWLCFGVDQFIDTQTGMIAIDVEDLIARADWVKSKMDDKTIKIKKKDTLDEQIEALERPSEQVIDQSNKRFSTGGYYPLYGNTTTNIASPSHTGDRYYGAVKLRYILSRDTYQSIGFVMNRNAGDQEEALAFLDFAISFKQQVNQLRFYSSFNGMVNRSDSEALKVIERKDMQLDPRAQALRDAFYERLNQGQLTHLQTHYNMMVAFQTDLYELIQTYLLSDQLTKEDFSMQLNRIKNAYMFRLLE